MTSDEIHELKVFLGERFEQIDKRFDGMDEEHRDLVHLLGKRFTSIDERLEGLDEGVRKNGVTLEEVRGELGVVAEGVLANGEKLEAAKAKLVKKIEGVDDKVHFLGEHLVPRIEALEKE